jgi:hypothetical protein
MSLVHVAVIGCSLFGLAIFLTVAWLILAEKKRAQVEDTAEVWRLGRGRYPVSRALATIHSEEAELLDREVAA